MPDSLDESDLNLPCPVCGYDLRAQIEARCPECGRVFASLQDLCAIAMDAKQVLNRVRVWRFKFSVAYVMAMAWVPIALIYVDMWSPQPGPGMTLGIVVAVAPMLLMPLLAIYFLVRVLRLRFDDRIGNEQRRGLNGTIPLLIAYTLPALVFLPVVVMAVFKKAWLGTGV